MIETAPILSPDIINLDGQIGAIASDEFALVFIDAGLAKIHADKRVNSDSVHALATYAGFSNEAHEAACSTQGVPVFVDLRNSPTPDEIYTQNMIFAISDRSVSQKAGADFFDRCLDSGLSTPAVGSLSVRAAVALLPLESGCQSSGPVSRPAPARVRRGW